MLVGPVKEPLDTSFDFLHCCGHKIEKQQNGKRAEALPFFSFSLLVSHRSLSELARQW